MIEFIAVGLGLLLAPIPPPSPMYSPERTLRFDYSVEDRGPMETGFDHVVLQVTVDNGQTWREAAVSRPGQGDLVWTAPADGRYGFRVIAYDRVGNHEPLDDAGPEQVVIVDTTPPSLRLRSPGPNRFYKAGSPVPIAWSATDENLRPEPVQVEYSINNEGTMRSLLATGAGEDEVPLDVPADLYGLRVRVTARDLAGNRTVTQYYVGRDWIYPPQFHALTPTAMPLAVPRLGLEVPYGIEPRFRPGLRAAVLWLAPERGPWRRVAEDTRLVGRFAVDAEAEGWWGIYVIGIYDQGFQTEPDPGPGSEPMARILVDTHAPEVDLEAPIGGSVVWRGGNEHLIAWVTADNVTGVELGYRLEYSLSGGEDGSWRPIPVDPRHLEVPTPMRTEAQAGDGATTLPASSGQGDGTTSPTFRTRHAYHWLLPRIESPDMRVRVTVIDLAGNETNATSNMIRLERGTPLPPEPLEQPPVPDVDRIRARWLLAQGTEEGYRQAIDLYDQILTKNPNDPVSWHDRGVAKFRLGRVAEALEDFHGAVERLEAEGTKDPEVFLNLSRAYRKIGQFSSAYKNLDDRLIRDEQMNRTLSSDQVDALCEELHALAMNATLDEKDTTRAVGILERLLALPRISDPWAAKARKSLTEVEKLREQEIRSPQLRSPR